MADEYISREDVLDIIEDMRNNHFILMGERANLAFLKSKITELPVADVQPVKRGHWEEHHATYIKQLDAWFVQAKCSCCGRYSDKMDNYSQYLDLEYCSHCGVRMMKEGNTNG